MDFAGNYFRYNNIQSMKYDLVFANVDTEEVSALCGEIQQAYIFDKASQRRLHVGEMFDDSALSFEAEVVTSDGRPITNSDMREIEKWLFRSADYKKLYIDEDCDEDVSDVEYIYGTEKRLYLNCRLTSPSKIIGNGGTIGYRFMIECDSAMAWQDPIIYSKVFLDGSAETGTTFSVDVDTDIMSYVYPKVKITMGESGGDITIINTSDDTERSTTFVGLSPNIELAMSGNGINYISGGNYEKFTSKNFIRMIDGKNTFSILGDIKSIEFEFQNQRYI